MPRFSALFQTPRWILPGRGRSIRFQLICLVAVCVVPVWIAAALLVHHGFQAKRALVTQNMQEMSHSLSMVVDRELASVQAALTALATSPSFASGDLAAVHDQAARLLRSYPGANIVVSDARGQQLVNLRRPFGAPLPKRNTPETVRRIFQNGKPVVSDLYRGALSGKALVAVDVPVFRQGRVAYDLSMAFPSGSLEALLSRHRLFQGRIASILDGNGVVVATSHGARPSMGQMACAAVREAAAGGGGGVVRSVSLEGDSLSLAFTRTSLARWTVVIGVPEEAVTGEPYRWLAWALTGALVMSIAGMALAIRVGRGIAGSIRSLIAPATALGRGDPLGDVPRSGLQEVDEVGQALMRASDLALKRQADRDRIQKLLRQSRQRYRSVVEDQTELIARFRPDGTLSFVNRVFCRLFGKTREELLGEPCYSVALPEDVPFIRERLRILSPSNPVVVVENRVRIASGGLRWVQFVNRGVFDCHGQLRETQSVGRDVTMRKRAEAELRENQRLLQAVINAVEEVIFVKDREGRFILVNPALLTLLGKPARDVLGKRSCQLYPDPADAELFMENDLRVMADGQPETLEESVPTPSGYRLLRVTRMPRFDAEGRVIGIIGMGHDITERRETEGDLRAYARRIMDVEEELRKVVAAELHDEIGRDLTVLGINLSIVARNLPPEADALLRTRMDDSARVLENVSRTVRNIMATLRPPVLDDYGLAAALRWYGELFSRRTGISVAVQVGDDFPRLSAEREIALFRIAQEALTNVSKHAAARNVVITLEQAAGAPRFSVADDGRGVAGEQLSRNRESSGWGVTIMRERAELFGGVFCLDSTIGGGTTVTVELPKEEP
jgi:PAS domain S-box-containing protein